MKKVLHLVNDEKFIQFAHESFSEPSDVENAFLVITDATSLKHIKFECTLQTQTEFYSQKNWDFLKSFDLIVIHFLDVKYNPLLEKKAQLPKILWIGWGGDYYWMIDTLPDFHMFKPQTRKLVPKITGLPLVYHIFKKINKIRRKKRVQLLNAIEYFSPVLEDDYQLIKKQHPFFQPKYIPWNYGNLEDNYIKGFEDFVVSKNDILIGNSATLTNNHLDVFKSLKKLDVLDSKIILPLNYGDKSYAKIIKEKALQQFGSQAVVLDDFLPYMDYMELLKNCSNVIMGHVRQQALGNIIAMLYVGAKLYFFEDSITYHFLKDKGFKVFSIETLQANPDLLSTALSAEEIALHREKLVEIWGKAYNQHNTRNIIKLVS